MYGTFLPGLVAQGSASFPVERRHFSTILLLCSMFQMWFPKKMKYRERAKLTQGQLADQAGVGTAFISRVERGEKMMKLKTLYAIADALQVGFDALVYQEHHNVSSQNIIKMLSNKSPEFISGVEQLVRVCIDQFDKEDL